MLVCCTSDLHGHLPEIPDCELLLIAGDLCGPSNPDIQWDYLDGVFREWVESLGERDIEVVCVEGNHGILAGRKPDEFERLVRTFPGNFCYLEDELVHLYNYKEKPEGLSILGTPSSLPFGSGWAFNYSEEKIKEVFQGVEKVDIIISHGPPFGIGDVPGGWNTEHTGSIALRDAIERIKPKLVATAHIHGSYGIYHHGETIIVNGAHMDEEYRPVNPPILVEI